jgi:hypothetical protein
MSFRINSIIFMAMLVMFATPGYGKTNDDTSYLTLSAGHVAIFDSGVDEPLVVKIEYRFKPQWKWDLAPAIGVARNRGGADFIFAFVEKDFHLSDKWVSSVNFGVGSFRDGGDLELGKDIEFRSGVRIAYKFVNNIRVGVELFHISNGGLGDLNPGTEPAFISVSIPF